MKLKVSIEWGGSEIAVNEVPKKIYAYIQKNFGGSIKDYAEALDNGKVPDEYGMVDGTKNGFVKDGEYHAYGASLFDAIFTVEDADTRLALLEAEDCNKYVEEDPYGRDDAVFNAKTGKHFVLGQSIERGNWNEWHIDTKGKRFSKKKLKIMYETMWFGMNPYVTITGLKYDGVDYGKGNEVLSTKREKIELGMF